MTTRRVTFNLNKFIEDLASCFDFDNDEADRIDDVVQTYKDFLSRAKEPVKSAAIKYVENHKLVTDNQRVRSFIKACHK